MKLSEWCRSVGLCYHTGWRLFKAGKLPVRAYQLASGTILVEEDPQPFKKNPFVVVYARVSSSENKKNLEEQALRVARYANATGLTVNQVIKEIGSGINDKRPKLLKILSEGQATHLIVEHKDRLARFGVEYIKILCKHMECKLVVVNTSEEERQDLIQDFVSVITSFCARIYGQRRSRRKTEKLISTLEAEK